VSNIYSGVVPDLIVATYANPIKLINVMIPENLLEDTSEPSPISFIKKFIVR
jgi:hypothetical protein